VIAVDINEENLRRAKSFGAAYTIHASNGSVVDQVLEITGDGADVSMDALGSHETSLNSIHCLAKKGKHIQVGILGTENEIQVSTAELIAKEIELIGSHGMPIADYAVIFDLVASGKINLSLLIDRTVRLEDLAREMIRMDNYSNSGMVVIDRF